MGGDGKSPPRSKHVPFEDLRVLEAVVGVEVAVASQLNRVGVETARAPPTPCWSCYPGYWKHHCWGTDHPKKGRSQEWTSDIP